MCEYNFELSIKQIIETNQEIIDKLSTKLESRFSMDIKILLILINKLLMSSPKS